jgi:protein-L-isoaspartate(D-aspartate) O-methyltransferase
LLEFSIIFTVFNVSYRILGAAGDQVYLRTRDADSTTNEDLVNSLVNQGALFDDRIRDAMLACDRGRFIPQAYKDLAYIDQPIHVSEWMSNISAPHIYISFLNELDIREGMSVVDIGVGSGISSAYCAMLAGRSGKVVGIDVNISCVEWARSVLNECANESETPFARLSADVEVEHGDAFIACYGEKHRGKYDRVFVGAACPKNRVHSFLQFLKPSGGKIVVPISPSELTLIEKYPTNELPVLREILKVRFTELDVPSELQAMHAIIKSRRSARLKEKHMTSTYAKDLMSIARSIEIHNSMDVSGSPASIQYFPSSPNKVGDTLSRLGEPDCILQGSGWSLKVHSVVLRQRCQYFRARAESGMKDSSLSFVLVPEGFSEMTAKILVNYLYHDKFDVSKQSASAVLEMSHYYGVPRMVNYCENLLGDVLKKANRSERHIKEHCEAAISLFMMAQTFGLSHLSAVSLDFLATNFKCASEDEAFSRLDAHQITLIADEACSQVSEMTRLMSEMQQFAMI